MLGEQGAASRGLCITLTLHDLTVTCRRNEYIFEVRGAALLNVAEMREFMGSLSAAMHMIEGLPTDDEDSMPQSPSEVPIREEGPCGECDAASGITAKGKYRQCTNCGYMWRVP